MQTSNFCAVNLVTNTAHENEVGAHLLLGDYAFFVSVDNEVATRVELAFASITSFTKETTRFTKGLLG